jgi:surfeit locus 1 family protein
MCIRDDDFSNASTTQPIATFALGTWQVKRLKWKVNLIDELNDKLSREPMRLPRRIK